MRDQVKEGFPLITVPKQFASQREKPEYQAPRGLSDGTQLRAGITHRAEQGLLMSRSRVKLIDAFPDEPTHLHEPVTSIGWMICLPGGVGSLVSKKQTEGMLK